jgi:methionyl-tRNA formyltransferase
MKIVFLGTPEISCRYLESLVRDGYDVAGVISQPDKPQGRGLCVSYPPVKEQAKLLNLKIFQPKTGSELCSALKSINPDLCVAVAYGRLLKKDAIEIPKIGFLNVHFSLLPKYRGAAPVQWSLINGEKRTGVTIFWLDEGMDTGPVFSQRESDIHDEDDAWILFDRLTGIGTQMMLDCLNEIKKGAIVKIPQTGPPSYAPMITTDDTWLDFNDRAINIHNKVRGLVCGPQARFCSLVNGKKMLIQVIGTSLVDAAIPDADNISVGTIIKIEKNKGFFIKCKEGHILIEEVRPEGRKIMKSLDFLNGSRLKVGDVLVIAEK